jgi:hypothetical protein
LAKKKAGITPKQERVLGRRGLRIGKFEVSMYYM